MPLRIFHHGHFKKAENRLCWICQWVKGVHVGMGSLLSTICVEIESNSCRIMSRLPSLWHVVYLCCSNYRMSNTWRFCRDN
jgi:hypothetical protein